MSNLSIGSYLICNDKFTTKFFSPYTFLYQYHSWYLSDTPIAVLCLDSTKFLDLSDNIKQKIFQLIKLEIDLMEAAGLTLVLCYNGLKCTQTFLYQIITDNQFSELHINIFDEKFSYDFLKAMVNKFNKTEIFKGYVYFYSCFFKFGSHENRLMKMFSKMPRKKVISFSAPLKEALQELEFTKTNPFPYCKTGFDHKCLRICLCYVPLYDINSSNVVTFDFTDFGIGYISIDDFLIDSHKRTPIYIDDDNFMKKKKAINFSDIHFVRPDLFVKNTLFLMQMEEQKHEEINQIKDYVDKEFEDKTYDTFQKKWNPKKVDSKLYLNDIQNIICGYTFTMRKKFNQDFSIRHTQIYAILESYQSFIRIKNQEEKKQGMTKENGTVYQIKTGEGKSCIVSLIAAILAKSRKIVHVVSSNIKLSNRDYLDSLDFFKNMDIKSTVLLHHNELPYYTKDKSIKVESEYLEAKKNGKYPDEFFSDDKFHNTSRMNFIACGLSNENKYIPSNENRIIFSTIVNFECFYLYMMENCPNFIEDHFKNCVLLIDEADSILIDEISNGTIISREMKSNAKDVLSIVYKMYQNKKSAKDILKNLKEIPMCDHITLDDVKQMLKEIQIAESPEFSDGKKYAVEKFSVKNKNRIKNFLKRTVRYLDAKNIEDIKDKISDDIKCLLFTGGINDNDSDNGDDYDDEEYEEEKLDLSRFKEFKKIVPYDYDHKGILEPNKEFSGFIPQFIALKEKKEHPDLIFKDISISYLYVSHPIFASFYRYTYGFTGTIGKLKDREILLNQYHLISQKIYRHKPNLMVEFPMTVCNDIKERNKKISKEVLYFHKKGNPVLVIFQDYNEIIDAVIAIQNEFVEYYEKIYDEKMDNLFNQDKNNIINSQRQQSNKLKKFVLFNSPNDNEYYIHDTKIYNEMKITHN